MSVPNTETLVTISLRDLEQLIRRAVHDEMTKLIQRQPSVFNLEPGTPLYKDMKAIAGIKKRANVKVYSRQEAFGA